MRRAEVDPSEGYAAGLARAKVLDLDRRLAQLKTDISSAALACIRGSPIAERMVKALLDSIDQTRAELREIEAP